LKGVYSLPKNIVVLIFTGSDKNPHRYDDGYGSGEIKR